MDSANSGERDLALESARKLVGLRFADKETPQACIDSGLVHRFSEAINRSTHEYKTSGKRLLAVDGVPSCVLAQFGQGVWGPFQTDLPEYGGYLFGEIETTFFDKCELGQAVESSASVVSIEKIQGKRVHEMIKFTVALDYTVNETDKPNLIAHSELTLLRLHQ
jgi:hypothetical protein